MNHKLLETEDGCLYIENAIPHLIDGVFVHCDIYKWSPSKAKEYKVFWKNMDIYFKNKGVKAMYAIPPSDKEEKLMKMFSFRDTGLTFCGYKLMRYE